MPSLIGSGIDANYRKQEVPFSRFGSRKIVWFTIGYLHNRTEGYDILDYELNTLIDTIQTRAEIVTIGAPRLGDDWGRITVGLFEDTFNNGNDTKGIDDNSDNAGWNDMATTLEQAIKDALDDNSIDVHQVYLYGGWNNGSGDQGWTTSDDYQEYGSKAEFRDNSYLHDDDNPLP